MNRVEQIIALRSQQHYGSRVPMAAVGEVMRVMQPAVRNAVRMAFEGRSSARGNPPGWLMAASDIRFLGLSGDDDSILHFEAPTLGGAAEQLYAQQEFWSTRPDPSSTGIDLFAHVMHDIEKGNRNSERYDRPLLRQLTQFDHAVDKTFNAVVIEAGSAKHPRAVIDYKLIERVRTFYNETPPPQPVRIVGTLDMIRASTQAFALKLASGEEVRGIAIGDDLANLRDLFRTEVLVFGKAVFRPSGQMLRVDADEIGPAEDRDQFFAKMPKPRAQRFDSRKLRIKKSQTSGVAAIVGKWPGDESDEEVQRVLQEIG